jgi:hypothetical protein
MKIKRIITFTVLAFSFSSSLFSQVGIGTITPNASAELDVTSTTKGFLPPRMTQAQRNAIAIPVAAGLQVWCTNCGTSGELQVYNGTTWTNMIGGGAAEAPFVCGTSTVTFTYNGASVTYHTVSRAYGGTVGTKCWLDRNLGATQFATNINDANSYGDLFQWGRGADGHQITTSNQTTGQSTSTSPGSSFLVGSSNWYTGTSPIPDNLWQGVSGTNNPCPSGFRLPTDTELVAEYSTWSSSGAAGAFSSPLLLPSGGARNNANGSLYDIGSIGYYRSSAVSGALSSYVYFNGSGTYLLDNSRGNGQAVRCIKD